MQLLTEKLVVFHHDKFITDIRIMVWCVGVDSVDIVDIEILLNIEILLDVDIVDMVDNIHQVWIFIEQ